MIKKQEHERDRLRRLIKQKEAEREERIRKQEAAEAKAVSETAKRFCLLFEDSLAPGLCVVRTRPRAPRRTPVPSPPSPSPPA
jgi:hypothetical protein